MAAGPQNPGQRLRPPAYCEGCHRGYQGQPEEEGHRRGPRGTEHRGFRLPGVGVQACSQHPGACTTQQLFEPRHSGVFEGEVVSGRCKLLGAQSPVPHLFLEGGGGADSSRFQSKSGLRSRNHPHPEAPEKTRVLGARCWETKVETKSVLPIRSVTTASCPLPV